MKTSLVIVDYKTMRQTIAYLEHCSKMILDWKDVSVVIVDNDPDKTGEARPLHYNRGQRWK